MHDQTFLHEIESTSLHQRHRRRRFFRFVLTVFFVLTGIWFILIGLALGQLFAAGLDLRDAVIDANRHANEQAFHLARKDIDVATRAMKELERSFYFFRVVWIFPGLDPEFEDLQSVFVSSRQVFESLDAFFQLGEDVIQLTGFVETSLFDVQGSFAPETTFKDLPTDTKKAILKRLSTASNDFDLLSVRIGIAKIELHHLRTNRFMVPFLGLLDPFLDRMKAIQEELQVASTLAHVLPELAGLDGDRTHLVLFLNNDELRPGGGFIGTYGILKTSDGEIISFATKDVYAFDNAVASNIQTIPPVPLQKYNAMSLWFFRDGNWSPDFATSAKQVTELFEQESQRIDNVLEIPSSTQIDGVIGFTPSVASALLAYLGPVQAGGQTFTAANVPELIEYQVERGFQENGIPYTQRKEILSELVITIQDRLTSLPFDKWPDIFWILSSQIQNKQIAMYSENISVQHALSSSGWGGVVTPIAPDVQFYVDANLASLKTDPVVERTLNYELFRNESGTWIGRTTVTYHHQGVFDWRTTRYRTYARLYVPSGTQLIQVEGFSEGPVIEEELGLVSIGGFLVIEPGAQHEVTFEYRLADQVVKAIALQRYILQVFKQMGTRDYPLTLTLDFDKNVTDALPAENRQQWGDDRYNLNTKLIQDMTFKISL